ncbi:MAG: O-antigen ligase family protein [Candidatus Roizmanbacteria bacterium]
MKKLKKKKASRLYFEKARHRVFSSTSPPKGGSPKSLTQKQVFSPLLINKYLLLFFLFLLPTQFGKHFFPSFSYLNGVRVDYLSPTLYLTDIIVFLLFIFNLKTVINFFKDKKILIGLGLLFINVIFAKNQSIAFYRLTKIVEFLIVFSLGQQLFKIVKEKILLTVLLLTGSFQLILTILQLIFKHSIQGVFYFFGERLFSLSTPGIAKATIQGIEFLRPYGTFSHPNSLAGFFLLLYFFVLTNKKFNKYLVLKYSVIFIFSCLVFLTFSKVAILTFLILNTLYLVLNTKTSCGICKIARMVVPLAISLIFLQATTDVLTIEKRIELSKNSLNILSNNLLFGVGLGNYLIAQARFNSKYLLFFNQPVHNIFLLYLVETGLLTGGLIIVLIAKFIYKIVITNPYLIFVVLLTGLFDHYWLTLEQNFLLLALIYGSVSRSFLISRLKLRREVKYS